MKCDELKPVFVRHIPDVLEHGVLYVSEEFGGASHKCCCGCGTETVTPFGSPGDWSLTKHGDDAVSLCPSILNRRCGAHYFIAANKIQWT